MNSKIQKILSKKNKTKIICLTSYSKNMSEITVVGIEMRHRMDVKDRIVDKIFFLRKVDQSPRNRYPFISSTV